MEVCNVVSVLCVKLMYTEFIPRTNLVCVPLINNQNNVENNKALDLHSSYSPIHYPEMEVCNVAWLCVCPDKKSMPVQFEWSIQKY